MSGEHRDSINLAVELQAGKFDEFAAAVSEHYLDEGERASIYMTVLRMLVNSKLVPESITVNLAPYELTDEDTRTSQWIGQSERPATGQG